MDPIQVGSHLFSPDALQQAIAQTAGLAADKKGALIGSIDQNGVQVALVVKLSDHIEFQTALKMDPSLHNFSAGAKLIASW